MFDVQLMLIQFKTMSMIRSIPSCCSIPCLNNKNPSPKPPVFFFSRVSCSNIHHHDGIGSKNGVHFHGNQSLSLFSASQRGAPRDLAVYASIPPVGAPLPSGPPSNSWRNWLLGMAITLILPFFTHKWGPLQTILKRIDNAVETAEQVADVVEAVANKVDKLAEDISDVLPEGGKLRKAVDLVEDLAENVSKEAHLAGDLIDKVEEIEEKVESLIEPLGRRHHQAAEASEETNSNSHHTDQN